MPCDVRIVNGQPIIICYRGKPVEQATCVVCGGFAAFLCDYEGAPGKTCDAPLCGRCRINVGLKDYCPTRAGKPALVKR